MANRKVRIAYAADGAQVDTIAPCDWNPVVYNAARWHPSIHMPRWASRITLPLVSAIQIGLSGTLRDVGRESLGMGRGVERD